MKESMKKLLLELKEFQTARIKLGEKRFEIKRII
jgi:hypothetical protein